MRDDTGTYATPIMCDQERILRAAYETIKDPARWTQGCTARDESGAKTSAMCIDARRWCVTGAVLRASGSWFRSAPLLQRLDSLTGSPNLAWMVNDTTDHQTVMELLDRAIASYR